MTASRLGDHAASAAASEQWVQTAVDPARDAYLAGCQLAGCARLAAQDEKLPEDQRQQLTRVYTERAVELLRQAVRDGFKDFDQLRENKTLDPIRSHERFRKLLAELPL